MSKRNAGTTIAIKGPGAMALFNAMTKPQANVVLSREDALLIQRALSSVPATGDIVQAVCVIDRALS